MALALEAEVITMPSSSPPPPPHLLTDPNGSSSKPRKPFWLLLLNACFMLLGSGGPLLLRLYFLHGGRSKWLSSFIQVSGWPILLLPLSIHHLRHYCSSSRPRRQHHLSPRLVAVFSTLGLLVGVECYLYAYSSSYLPLSTSSLLSSVQLAFTAVFALLIVRQMFTPYSLNAIVLLTLGAASLSVGESSQLPRGESTRKYYTGIIMAAAAAGLMGLVLPLAELAFRKMKAEVTYSSLLEMQLVMGISGTLFCLVGALINKDFQAMAGEAKEFSLGEGKYYAVLIGGAIFWQIMIVGLVGLVSGSSSFVAAVLMAAILPVGQLMAVVFLGEKFDGSNGIALAISLWGLASYLYDEMSKLRSIEESTKSTIMDQQASRDPQASSSLPMP